MAPRPPVPTPAEVEAIVGTGDPVLRNLRITAGYHRMARAMEARVGPGANWFAFAVWASKQVGETIRGEDPWRWLERELALAPEVTSAVAGVVEALRPLGVRLDAGGLTHRLPGLLDVEGARRSTADALARGNAMVFQEVGGAGAAFLALASDGPTPENPDAWDGFLDGFPPGPFPQGQESLRNAFVRFHSLQGAGDHPPRQERLLLANLEIAVHEQLRLQPEIQQAMDSLLPGADAFRDRVLGRFLPGAWARVRVGFWRALGRTSPLDRAVERLRWALGEAFRRLLTRHVMAMDLAGVATLRLGEAIPGPVPPALTDPGDPELRALLDRYGVTGDGPGETGAADWSDVEQRLRFIAHLFRRYHELPDLFRPPFTPEQEGEMAAGRVPAGRL